MAPGAPGSRDPRRCRDRRPVRAGDRVRCRRHDDRADRRPRDGIAAAEPVPRAPADRALARGQTLRQMARRQLPPTSTRSSGCCCASRRWCARCRSCARWTSTRSSSTNRGALAVDARIVVDSAPQAPGSRPDKYGHLAIQPYPTRHEQGLAAARRGRIHRAADPSRRRADAAGRSSSQLSPESRYFRFVSAITELPPSMLARLTLIDYDREMALVAV